jgi:16S rRNA (cytidine1402-2'-O)-methyltransferase
MDELSKIDAPIVIYESALRLKRTLADIEQYFGKDCEIFIAREMTKMFEEYWGGPIVNIIADLKNHKLKGEVTLVAKRKNF